MKKFVNWIKRDGFAWMLLIMAVGFMGMIIADVIMLFILLCKLFYYGF